MKREPKNCVINRQDDSRQLQHRSTLNMNLTYRKDFELNCMKLHHEVLSVWGTAHNPYDFQRNRS